MISRAASKFALCTLTAAVLLFPAVAGAQSIIKQPGNHPAYSFEIEPHLAFQWAGRVWGSDGFGPGARFNIPFIQNGPIPSINNNMGITFGADLTFGGGGWNCYPLDQRNPGADCSVTELWLPVAMQWNFFLTKVISVFGEPGLAIVHQRWSRHYYCDGKGLPQCGADFSDTAIEPVFTAGGRFMFSDKIGATVRVGYPMVTAGINFLL